MISETIGADRVLDKLGEGGMGEVYRARDTRLQRDVALKILPPIFAGDPERLARFEREAQVLAALNHPHIAQIYGIVDARSAGALGEPDPAHGLRQARPAEARGEPDPPRLPAGQVRPSGSAAVRGGPAMHALLMELVEGETLADRIARGRSEAPTCKRLLAHLL